MPHPNNCLRYWDLADHIRIDDAIALWCGVEPAELSSLNFETQCMSAKRAALVTALRTGRLEYEDLGILTVRGQVFKGAPIDELLEKDRLVINKAKLYQMREKQPAPGQELMPERSSQEKWNELVEKYRLIETQQDGLTAADAARASGSRTFDLTARRVKRTFSPMTLVAEVSRYLNRGPLEIETLLDATKEGTDELVVITNEFNELLYDEIIPRLFRLLFDLDEYEKKDEYEVDLIKLPPNGYYSVSAAKDKIVRMSDTQIQDEERAKSFHLDTYCFDSGSENWLFWDLLREQRVKKIYFTGMLTHGQSDFFIQYIDPDSRTVRSYYPDFIFQREEPDGSLKYVIVEVKADNQIEDAVVQAKKDFAQQIAVASGMEYRILKSSDADKRHFRVLL